jgi:hypothetical protein
VKPDTEHIRGLNLAEVKLTTIQVTKLPLWHKVKKIGAIGFAKPGLTEEFQKEEFSMCAVCTLDKGQACS